MTSFRVLLAVLLVACLFLSVEARAAAPLPDAAGLMDISTDGALLACSNRDSGTVTIVDLKTLKKLREIKVCDDSTQNKTGLATGKPEGVAFLGDSHKLAVAVYFDDKVVFLDADKGDILGETPVFDEPYGVVSSAAGDRVYVTLSYPGQVVEIDTTTRKVTRTFEAGNYPRGLAITADNARLFATEYHTSNVHVIDTASGKVVDQYAGLSSDNIARHIVLHPKRAKAYVPHMRSAVERAHGEGSIFPYVTVIDTAKEPTKVPEPSPAAGASAAGSARPRLPLDKRRSRMPMDSFISVHVTANPWEIALAPDGRSLFVVFSGTNDLYACDVIDDDYREIGYRSTIQLGHNPRAVRVSPDSRTFFVYNALSFNVVAYDVKTLRKVVEIPVTQNPLSDELLLGKQLFYTALQPMTGRRWIACSSCHIDGESDLRTWQNPEGLRDTPALAGMAWTHPLHWSADRDETQDFEHTIRGNLMQGSGLIRGKVQPDFGPPNKGLSPQLDALAAYSASHKPALSPHAKNGLAEDAKRGRDVFFSAQTRCATCHSGPYFTDSVPAETTAKIVRHDVGTGKPSGDDPSEKMPPAYDTPTLLGVYKTAPYLHHGKAGTLEDLLTTKNAGDKHGKTSHLTKQQIADLIAFLKALPYEDPEVEAKKIGMKKVER